ncbi:hypothetical protein FRC15_011160 [Serendipita sp. 397]|nr:hypothetical protein FRC15_011160 [Serendipita sp. 397]
MEDGVQLIPKESCLVLCGTCDYISPEILAMQEAALVALDEEDEIFVPKGEGGYGRETDWWSLGATIYELIYGVAPFFAKDIRGTYELIMNHERNLRFPAGTDVSSSCVSFLSGLLRTATKRLGRHNIHELTSHKLFSGIDWSNLTKRTPPNDLHVPQFEYDIPEHSIPDFSQEEESYSKGYAFSAFFNSSVSSTSTNPNAGNVTFVRPPSPRLNAQQQESDFDVPPHLAQYVGFTWGPSLDAFDGPITSPKGPSVLPTRPSNVLQTPVPTSKQSRTEAYQQGLRALESLGSGSSALPSHQLSSLPHRGPSALVTPVRPASSSYYGTLNVPPSTIRRAAGGTARKTGSVRTMSEVEQLKQLSDCVRASARKRLSDHAGRTPGPAGSAGTSTAIGGGGARAFGRAAGRKSWDVSDGGASNSFASEHAPLRRRASWVKMTLDFENVGEPVARAKRDGANSGQRVGFVGYDEDGGNDVDQPSGLRIFVKDRQQRRSGNNSNRNSLAMSLKSEKDYAEYGTRVHEEDESTGGILFGTVNSSRPRSQQRARTSARDSDTSFTTTDEEPPSPSPSPRPGSGLLRPSSRKGGATLSSRPSFGTLPRQGPSFRQHGHSASISTLNLAEQIPLTHSAPGSLQERAKPKRTSIGSIFMRPASTSGKSSGSGQEEERAKESWNDPLGLGTSSAQMRQEEETEETPRARRQYSSSIGAMDARATSQLRVPIFTRRQTSKQSLDQELTKKNEVVDPFGGEASQLQPQVHSQDDPLVAGPTTETTSKDPNSVGETYPDVSEMEERLRKMMNDLQKVEGGLKAVRARLKA